MIRGELIEDAAVSQVDLETAAEQILAGQLPVPVSVRWKPLRMGMMNLFLFDDERFPFADGRLLLRGSNGAGKSRVLAMTLPLLLDGSLSANRVEPDRDPNRQVAWNLLMDDQNARTGYSWLELGRVEAEGAEKANGSPRRHHFLTIGCGMKAVRGQPIKPWFFITDLRVDASLELKSPDGVPLTQRQLSDMLGDRGQIIETAREYKRAIDEKLFRLGERYEPLLDLLLQLRQPQLAKKLDLDQLESALRTALPALSDSLLDDAAEAFRDLDQYRAQLASDRQTLDSLKSFLRPYRDHVQRGVLRSAKRLTKANSEYETAQRQQRQANDDLENNRKLLNIGEDQIRALRIEFASAEAALEVLQNRPEMQDAARLDQLARSVDRQRGELDYIAGDLQRARDNHQAANERLEGAEAERQKKQDAAKAAADRAAESAAPEALANRHRELIGPLLAGDLAVDNALATLKAKLTATVSKWRKSADHLAARNEELAAARTKLRDATHDTSNAKDQRDRVTEELGEAELQEHQECQRLWTAIMHWWQTDSPLRPYLPPIGPLSDKWHDWARSLESNDPLSEVVTAAEQQAERTFSNEEAALLARIDEQRRLDENLAAEQMRLELGLLIEPPAPHTRDPDIRATSGQGAPFWKLVDFVDGLPQAERGNWEAALEAAGLLDAWLNQSGTLFDPNRHDTQIIAGDDPPLPEHRQLRRVLRAASDCAQWGVTAQVVDRLLTVIGVGIDAGRVWVDRNGRWQNGPLHGCWTKDNPQFIGEPARNWWRSVRLAEVIRERSDIDAAVSEARTRLEQIGVTRAAVFARRQQLPSAAALAQRNAEVGAKRSQLAQAEHRHGECQRLELECRDLVTALAQRRDQDAADAGLIAWIDRVDELYRRLTGYEARLEVLWVELENLATTKLRLDEARRAMEAAASVQRDLQNRRDLKQLELTKEEAMLRELDAASGQAAAEMIKRLEVQREAKNQLGVTLEELRSQNVESEKRIAVIESNLARLEETSQRCDGARHEAADWFGNLGPLGLIEFAVDDLDMAQPPWSMTQAIKVARTCDATLADNPGNQGGAPLRRDLGRR